MTNKPNYCNNNKNCRCFFFTFDVYICVLFFLFKIMGKIYNGITNHGIIHICIDINIYIIEDNIVALISTTRYIYIYIYIFSTVQKFSVS